MPDFSHYPLQKAIYQTLSGDSALGAIISGVFDTPPQDQAYPYVTIGESAASDWSTMTTHGTEHVFSVHAWSREGGKKQAESMMGRIYALLHDASIAIEGHSLILMRFQSSAIELESDGWTHHGRMRFRALLEAGGS